MLQKKSNIQAQPLLASNLSSTGSRSVDNNTKADARTNLTVSHDDVIDEAAAADDENEKHDASLQEMLAKVKLENVFKSPGLWLLLGFLLFLFCLIGMRPTVGSVGREGWRRQEDAKNPSPKRSPASSVSSNLSPFMTMEGGRTPPPEQLCPGLVVPHGSECLLAVPCLARSLLSSLNVASRLDVQTLDGKSVIQADVIMPHSAKANQRPLVALWTAAVPGHHEQTPCLAYCQTSPDYPSRHVVSIFDSRRQLFGQIAKEPGVPCYALTSAADNIQLLFEGDFQNHAVSVTSNQPMMNNQKSRQLVAETSASVDSLHFRGSYYQLRVVSSIDVGLMLCAFFAIDFMEMS